MITTNTGAKKLESSDNWREIFPDNQGAQGAHNASVGAHDTAISQMCQTVSGTTNNCGHTINAGEYFIANGGKYKATASIPVNEAWSGSAQAVSDNDLINALNNNITTLSNKLNYLSGTFNINEITLANFQNAIINYVYSMSNGSVAIGVLTADYGNSPTGGQRGYGAIYKYNDNTFRVIIWSHTTEAYYYSNTWHWKKATMEDFTPV